MSGTQTLIDRILAQAREEGDRLVKEADQQAAQRMQQADREAALLRQQEEEKCHHAEKYILIVADEELTHRDEYYQCSEHYIKYEGRLVLAVFIRKLLEEAGLFFFFDFFILFQL